MKIETTTSRRIFIQFSASSAFMLTGMDKAHAALEGIFNPFEPSNANTRPYLKQQMMPALRAIAPVMIGIDINRMPNPEQFYAALFAQMEEILVQMGERNRGLILKLFRALNDPFLKPGLTFTIMPWHMMGWNEISGIIARWRESFLQFQIEGASVLTLLSQNSWYFLDDSFKTIDYTWDNYNE